LTATLCRRKRLEALEALRKEEEEMMEKRRQVSEGRGLHG
jgi:hypothetical protein